MFANHRTNLFRAMFHDTKGHPTVDFKSIQFRSLAQIFKKQTVKDFFVKSIPASVSFRMKSTILNNLMAFRKDIGKDTFLDGQ